MPLGFAPEMSLILDCQYTMTDTSMLQYTYRLTSKDQKHLICVKFLAAVNNTLHHELLAT